MSDEVTVVPGPVTTIVTAREDAPRDGTLVRTPGDRPDIIIKVMTPLLQVVVRGLRTYVQGLIGFLLLGLAGRPALEGLGVVIPPGDFLDALRLAGGLAFAPTVISVLQNLGELLLRLDQSLPKWRA